MQLSKAASRHFKHGFRNAFYIGRFQIYPAEHERRPHKFYYIGYRDLFGVAMPESKGRVSFQIWGTAWVYGRSEKLDKALRQAMKGNFPEVRHNVRARARAESHGRGFIKPKWAHPGKAVVVKEETEKLPIRGRRKRKRRKLLV